MSENSNTNKTEEELEKYKKELFERANKKFADFNNQKRDENVIIKSPGFIDKAKSFVGSTISRGITNKHCDSETKELRILSCHGDGTDALPPCSERRTSSKFEDSYYCGACGCGDKKGTQLVNLSINNKENYSKLDYPTVSCPFKMPGFSDYAPTASEVSDNIRKKEIEKRLGIDYTTKNSK